LSYIGKTPTIGNFQICDAITVVDAQAAYTMQVGVVDVSPESANHMIVSLNGVIQKPTDAFTVAGSTITFASALETGDVIDFIQILGNVLDLGVPSDGTVSTAKIVDGAVTSAKLASGVGGKLLQVVQTAKTDTFSSASASWVDITGLSLSITPSAASSKVLITANFVTSHSGANSLGVRLMRDSTSIFAGDDTATRKGTTSWQFMGSANRNTGSNSFQYVDSPSTTSATTYKLQIWSTGGTAYIGQMQVDSDNTTYGRSASSIIAMEIGA